MSYFYVNTDLKSYKRYHPRALIANPIYYWLNEGYAYLTPTLIPGPVFMEEAEQNKRKSYRDYLREMEIGSVIYAYESITGAGYVAAGVIRESWDERPRSGRSEIFMDDYEIYYRIRVEWDAHFSCSLQQLKEAGFGARLPAVGPINDKNLAAFLEARRA